MTVINCENTCIPDQSIQTSQSLKSTLFTRVWIMLKSLSTLMKNRRSVEKLNHATDHELADMGLRREDLYVINHGRMFTDPSIELQRRAFENNRGCNNR